MADTAGRMDSCWAAPVENFPSEKMAIVFPKCERTAKQEMAEKEKKKDEHISIAKVVAM